MLPKFVGVGVPRCATTWLHGLLASHPDIYVPARRKEVNFFNTNYHRGLAWYEAYFPPDRKTNRYKTIGEINPLYWVIEKVPQRLVQVPSIRQLIVMFRDPVERVYSHYKWARQINTYQGSFKEFLDRPWGLTSGFYCRDLKRYLRFFDREQILVLIYEHVFADVEAAKRTIADFLGVDAGCFPPEVGQRVVNRGFAPRFRRAYNAAGRFSQLLRRVGVDRPVMWAKRLDMEKLFRKAPPFPPMSDDIRRYLAETYEPEIRDLESLLGLDLSCWR